VVKALAHWRPHLGGSHFPIKLLTDHANLTYWKHPQKVNHHVARWFGELQDYNLEIHHIPGKIHPVDMLSQPNNVDKGELDNQNVTVLPEWFFIQAITIHYPLHTQIRDAQLQYLLTLRKWKDSFRITPPVTLNGPWLWASCLVIPPNSDLKRTILKLHHDDPSAGYPGRDKTLVQVQAYTSGQP
jgi:hypothetical protein